MNAGWNRGLGWQTHDANTFGRVYILTHSLRVSGLLPSRQNYTLLDFVLPDKGKFYAWDRR